MRTVKCPYCGNVADHIKNGWGQKYQCVPCDASVGCHPGTDKPLGTLAKAELRAARSAAHAAFDPLWKVHGMVRRDAYQWLADQLGIPVEQCHVGMFDEARCADVVKHATGFVLAMATAEQLTPSW